MNDSKMLYEEIGKFVLQLFKKQNVPEMISATVVSYSAPFCSLILAGSSVTLTGIKNLSGQTLATNDLVEVVVKNGDYSNMFVGWKR